MTTLSDFNPKKNTRFNILERVGANYSTLGTFLLDDQKGTKVHALEIEHKMNVQAIN